MSNKITYTIKTADGKEHQVSKENIDKYGIQSYASAYRGATIRMRDSQKGDYDIPLQHFDQARKQGLHAFSIEHTPIQKQAAPKPTVPTPTQTISPRLSTPQGRKPLLSDSFGKASYNLKPQPVGYNLSEEHRKEVLGEQAKRSTNPTNPHVQRAVQLGNEAKAKRVGREQKRFGKPTIVRAFDDAVHGDKKAAKELGMPQVMQQKKDEIDYMQATGKELRNPVDAGLTYDENGDIVHSMFAPTVARDEHGNIVTNDAGEPLVGVSSDEARAKAYGDSVQTGIEAQREKDKVDNLYKDAVESVNDAFDEDYKKKEAFRKEHPFLGAVSDALEGFSNRGNALQYVPEGAKPGLSALSMMTKAAQMKENADRYGDAGTLSRLYGGIMAGLTDVNTYDFGITDTFNAANLYRAAKNYEEGKATAKDKMLLDAAAIANNVQSEASDKLGGAFGAGQNLVGTIGFMAQMATNPASGVGKEAAASVAKTIAKRALQKFGNGAIAKAITGLAKGATRVGMDAVEAGVVTGMYSPTKIVGDYLNRKTGDVQSDGKGGYIFQNKEYSDVKALAKAINGQYAENISEMWGEYLPGVGKVNAAIGRGARKIGLGKVVDAFEHMSSSNWAKTWKNFQERTKWNGMAGEYFEEVANNLYNAVTNGDMTLDTDPHTGVFNPKINLDTFYSVALMSGIMSGVNTAGYARERYKAPHEQHKADAQARSVFGERWDEYKNAIDNADEKQIGSVMEKIGSDKSLSNSQKIAALQYQYRTAVVHGVNAQDTKNKLEGQFNAMDEAYSMGYNLQDEKELNNTAILYDEAKKQATKTTGWGEDTLESMIGEDGGASTLAYMKHSDEFNDGQLQAFTDYANARAAYNGMIQRVKDDIDTKVHESNLEAEQRTNLDTGAIHPATMKVDDRQVYIVNGNVVMLPDSSGVDHEHSDDFVVLRDAETGELETADPSAIFKVDAPINPQEEKEAAADNIRQTFAQQQADKIDGKLEFRQGDTYSIIDKEDGTQHSLSIIGDAIDEKTGQVNPKMVLVDIDGAQQPILLPKEQVQQQVDEARRAAVAATQVVENAPTTNTNNTYSINDEVTLSDENGNTVRGSITAPENEDGKFEVYTEQPINGKKVNLFSAEELDTMTKSPTDVAENTTTQQPQQQEETENSVEKETPKQQPTALERIPKDESGQPLYEQAEPETAWDAIVEQTEGNTSMAQTVADDMVSDLEAGVKKAEKTKAKSGGSIAEKIAAEKERAAVIEQAKATLAHWRKIAAVNRMREAAIQAEEQRKADEVARVRKEQEETARAEQEEAERIKREALNGVPDFVEDKATDARARGYRRVNGDKVDRQEPINATKGKEVQVKFDDDNIPAGHVAIIEANQLQPSHKNGQRNPQHFIDEAQPKERKDDASVGAARKIAANIRPEEITSSVTAYTGAPTVNSRGEVIQGNNRSAALREMWDNHQEQGDKYKKYLIDNAESFGLRAEDIAAMDKPVLVNMLDVNDDEAISLGQFVASDTESGGTERIKPKNVVKKLGDKMKNFANILLRANDENISFAELVDSNGVDALKWLNANGVISPTQYKSAFDSKGNITAEAKNDIKGIMYQSIFEGGNTQLEEMFNTLPAKAQKAILATAYRDYDSPQSERMIGDIQDSIMAYYALSHDNMFMNAKNHKDARIAVEAWRRQLAFDDVTGESYLPAEKYSNFALLLATMYKGDNQSLIQGTFNKMYDLIQGTQEETLFEQPDNTPRSLVQAIKETLNIEHNEQQRSNVLAGDSSASQEGRPGSNGDATSRGRSENSDGTETNQGGTEGDSGRSGSGQSSGGSQEEVAAENSHLTKKEAADFIAQMELGADVAQEIPLTIENWDKEFGEDGIVSTPIGDVKMGENQFAKLMRAGRNGKLGMLKPTLEYPDAIVEENSKAKEGTHTERPSSFIFIKSFRKSDGTRYYYFTSITVSVDGKEVVVSNQEKSRNRILRLLIEGNVIWRTPKDATTSSAEKQGLDYVHPDKAEGETKGSVITPQNTPSVGKDKQSSATKQEKTENFVPSPKNSEEIEEEIKYAQEALDELKEYQKRTDTTGRTSVDENGFDSEDLYIPLLLDGKSSRLGVLMSIPDRITNPSGQVATYDYSNDEGNADWQKWDDLAEEYNKDVGREERAYTNGDVPILRFKSVDAAVRFADWLNSKSTIEHNNNSSDEDLFAMAERVAEEDKAKRTRKKEEAKVDTNPTEAQKEAGNYKKGHIKVDGFNVTIEQPEGSVRRGKDANGKEWETEMHNTYGYIRGTESVDGDHIDIFLSDNPTEGNVFVVDQVNKDGSFDEHKVMYGFSDMESARKAYLSNYEEGWQGLGNITEVSKDEFKKWIDSSKRKTKPFAEYSSVKTEGDVNVQHPIENKGSKRLVSNERYEELKKRMRSKLGQLNLGVDPEMLAIGAEMAVYHIENGARAFGAYAKEMISDLGDAIRPYLKAFYNGARDLPEMTELSSEMTPYDEVSRFDVATIGNEGEQLTPSAIETAEQINNEATVEFNTKQEQNNTNELEDVDNNAYSITKQHNNKKDVDIWVVRGKERTDKDVYTQRKQVAKEHNGYYSSFRGVNGFVFNTAEEAHAFADAIFNTQSEENNAQNKEESQNTEVHGKIDSDIKSYLAEQINSIAKDKTIQQIINPVTGNSEEVIRNSVAKELYDFVIDNYTDYSNPKVKALLDFVIGDKSLSKEENRKNLDRIIDAVIARTRSIQKEDEGTQGFHGGERVYSLKHSAYKHIVAAFHGSDGQIEYYKFSDGTKANANEVQKNEPEKNLEEENLRPTTEQSTNSRLLAQYNVLKEKYPDTKILLRVGDFYETYQDDAKDLSKTLGIVLTKRNDGVNVVGFPDHSLDNYLPKLIRAGYRVAINDKDETANDTSTSNGLEGRFISAEDIEGIFGKTFVNNETGTEIKVGHFIYPYKVAIKLNGQASIEEWRHLAKTLNKEGWQEKIVPDLHGFNIGDKVMYKGKEATLYDIDKADNNRPILDTGLAPVVYEVANWDELLPVAKSNEAIAAKEEKVSTEKEKSAKKNNSKKKDVSLKQPTTGDLFGGFFDENESKSQNNEDNPRTRTKSRKGNDEVSQRESSGSRSVNERQLDADTEKRRSEQQGDSRIQGRTSKERSSTERPSGRLSRLNVSNNHAERGVDYAPTTVDARIEANIKAIELANELVESGEKATPEQMSVLRKFSGWGGLGKAFNQASYSWSKDSIPARLQTLLGAEGYEQAVMSANSAYYTPAYVIDTLWDVAKQMGFKGGNILEGSAGIGNILGLMPMDISDNSHIQAVEIDGTSGNILSLLYPEANVNIQGFEQTRVPNGSVDLAITNVPFVTGLRVNDTTGDGDLSKKFHNIHDFCIAKNVRKLREGGIGIFISSNGTLDSSQKLRDWLVSDGNADVVGAFRLNNKTFGGTGVTSDIIVIRKRVNGQVSPNAIDVSTITGERSVEFDTGETKRVKGVEIPVVKHLSMDYNKYFIEHPEMMAGKMEFAFEHGDNYRATSKGLYPTADKPQDKLLKNFVQSFTNMKDETASSKQDTEPINVYEELGNDVKEGSMLVNKDGQLCVAQLGQAVPLNLNANKVKGHTKEECFKAYTDIKQALNDVLKYQTANESNEGLQPLLDKLNKAYDSFVDTYGHLNKNTSIAFLRNDVDYPNVFSLEKYEEKVDKNGKRIESFHKTDIFKKRVVEKSVEPQPKNVKDGIVVSVYKFGKIDIPYISNQLGKTEEDVKREIIASGLGFENPVSKQVEVSYQYLSGNVRVKLKQAEENNEDGEYNTNIKALKEVVPNSIPAHLIEFNLGSSWIAPELYEEYVKDKTDVDVKFTAAGGTWFMKEPHWTDNEKNRSFGVHSDLLGKHVMGHELIEAAIQNKTITVSTTRKDYNGTTETITDKEATQACSSRIDEIRQECKDWARNKMQSDPEMSDKIERVYNDLFNNYVPIDIPSEYIPEHFGGATHNITLRPHQAKAVVRGTMQPLMLAHEVGTGKTFTLISTAMEMRRLGTARKPMIVVQNATVGQFVASAKQLYPNAKILTLEDGDRSAKGRKNFYAKIRYNDWDMIVVPQSTFEFIPDSEERQMAFIQDKIEEKLIVLAKMKDADKSGRNLITRQAEKEVEQLKEELADLTTTLSERRTAKEEKKRAVTKQNTEVKAREMLERRTDETENFDDMGIDALLIDEAHEYKHLGFATAMQRGVKGVDNSYSKKSQGVYLKTQAVLQKSHGRNVIFATGTPISNTAAEIWTFMRYLMPSETMKEYGIYYFDDFVRNFGNIQQMLEFTTSGKFKENNRFAGYIDLPELVRIWSSVSDTVRTKDAGGVSDKIPEMEGGKAQDLYLPQTTALRGIMKYVKAELEAYDKMSGKEKKENSHIPLTMYSIAKAAAVDARLVDETAEDNPNSKTNEAVRQTLRSLKETASYNGTVALFADNYQNKTSGFNLYVDVKDKLIAAGIPEKQIVVMKSGMTIKNKLEIFDKVNRGEVRVIMGSTFTLGTGVNIQERLHTLIHIDAPNRPMDYTQRNGRILRQGNIHKDMNKPVRVLRFGVEDSLDVTAYQRLKTKGAIAESIMNGKQLMANSMENRILEEEEDAFGDTVAQLSGSEYAMLKNQAEKNVRKYESRKRQWEADQTYIHNAKPRLNGLIQNAQLQKEENEKNLSLVNNTYPDGKFKAIIIGKHKYDSVAGMEDFFKDHNKKLKEESEKVKNGTNATYGSTINVDIDGLTFAIHTEVSKEMSSKGINLFAKSTRTMTYSQKELGLEGVPVKGALMRNAIEDITDNIITGNDFKERVERAKQNIAHYSSDLEHILSREGKPFEFESELEDAKAKFVEYTEAMKKEMEEKEKKYAEMDKHVEAVSSLSEVSEDEETLMRSGQGSFSDNELSFINDPVAKMLGKSNRAEEAHKAFAERERQRMISRINELADKLHLDNIETVTDSNSLQGKKAKAKGFYSKSSGKITIVIPNHASVEDVEKTLLHEAVAHYGLRKLFGEHFETFLDNVYQNVEPEIRRIITSQAANNNWDFRTATEEYLAGLAERTDFERVHYAIWNKIKSLFLKMLHSIGFENWSATELSDNELRYLLWRSYENMKEPGRYRSILGEAEDVAKQNELKVGNYDQQDTNPSNVAERGILYREDDSKEKERVNAREKYEQRVNRAMFQTQEALQDSMLGLKEAMNAITKAEGKNVNIEDIDGYENAYLGENRLSSVNKAEADAFAHLVFKPMLAEVSKLCKNVQERAELVDYMMAKHGLERNAVMRKRAIEDILNNEKLSDAQKSARADLAEYRDYAGLTALTGKDNVTEAEVDAETMVSEYENTHDTTNLWDKVNAVNATILSKSYECGMMDKDTYEKISDMYKYYIPLRGFDETTSEEAYAYLLHQSSAFNAPIKVAKGRSSKADDPFANMQSMAESAITQGNRNKLVKQRFFNFVLNHPSDLVSISDIWLKYDDVADEWKPVFPDNFEENDSAEDIEQKLKEFEDKMKKLAEQAPDKYKHGKETTNIPYRVVDSRDLHQHQVLVKRGGRDYILTLNGNPRAAQALNGQTNPDNDTSGAIGAILKAGEMVNRQLSAFYTTRNPDFVVSNFIRDMLFSNSIVWVKESPNYALRFHRNIARCNPAQIKVLLAKHRKGTLDMNNKLEHMFYQFMMNGGETGYANVRDIEQHKNDIRRELKRTNGKLSITKAFNLLGEKLDEYNRAVENCARFAAYLTSREMGRTVERSIYDAKEISVNFNKKGSGAKFMNAVGQTKIGTASAFVSGIGRSGFVFWNAAIQGTTNFGRQFKKHPAKAFTASAIMFLLGAAIAGIGMGDGDDDADANSYWNLPEYVRRSNILFKIGDQWVSIPLPVEYRAIYGMGELMVSAMSGKEHFTGSELGKAIAGQATQVLPIDFLEGGGGVKAFVPSAVKPFAEVYSNKSWTGMPIYKDTPYNKYMPEWTKAYKSANKYLVGIAKTLNEATGGDAYTKGSVDINPAQIEYLLNGYFGGVSGTIDKLSKSAETIAGDREYDPRNFLLLNRILKNGDERTEARAINNEYMRVREEHDVLKARMKHYENDTDKGLFDYADKIDFLYNSPEFARYEIFEDYSKDIDALYQELKEANDGAEHLSIEKELTELKKEMIEEMNKTRK